MPFLWHGGFCPDWWWELLGETRGEFLGIPAILEGLGLFRPMDPVIKIDGESSAGSGIQGQELPRACAGFGRVRRHYRTSTFSIVAIGSAPAAISALQMAMNSSMGCPFFGAGDSAPVITS